MKAMRKLTLFYDGLCPLCRAEILFLSDRNQAGLLDFVDINSDRYSAEQIGVSCEQALASMMASYDDGEIISGVDVFVEAYRRAKLPLLAWIFSRPVLRPLFNVAYRFFAKHRHIISKIFGPGALWMVRFSRSNR